MNTNKSKASRNRRLSAAHPYIYASFEFREGFGVVAVINAEKNEVVERITVGKNPGPMALDPAEEKLYVVNNGGGSVTIINTATLKAIATPNVGTINTPNPDPVAILTSPNGDKVYVANAAHRNVSIIDSQTNRLLKNVDVGPGRPFAFANSENSNYMFVACKLGDEKDYVKAISIKDDSVHPCYEGFYFTFDEIHNPLAFSQGIDSSTQVVLGREGALCFVSGDVIGKPAAFSLLDSTVSGIFVDNQETFINFLFCTTPVNKKILKRYIGLQVDESGNVDYDTITDSPSYKGQDIIRASSTQQYIGITVQPTTIPQGGLQIYDSIGAEAQFIPLSYVGDLTFYGDTRAYVAEPQALRPIDLASATVLPVIPIYSSPTTLTIKNLISGYRSRS